MDAVVMRLQLPPLREIELAEAEVLECQRARVNRAELVDRLAASLARGPHRREQLGDRPAALRPDDLRRIGRARRRPRERLGPGGGAGETAGSAGGRARA